MKEKRFKQLENRIQREGDNVAGVGIYHKDKIVYEKYYLGYDRDRPIHIASLTKSLVSLLVGIALDYGYIESVQVKVLDFFPDYQVKRGEKRIQEITIEDLLTMRAPYKYKTEPYTKVYSSDDWTKAALDFLGGRKPVGAFTYSTVGTQILSGILVAATGKSLVDFASEFLFKPLGIEKPVDLKIGCREDYMEFVRNRKTLVTNSWVVDPFDCHTGGWGLALKTRDLMKIGNLCLKGGICEGRRIISEEWLSASTKTHISWQGKDYGYLWWIMKSGQTFAGLGDGGGMIYVDRNRDLLVVMTAEFKVRVEARIVWVEGLVLEELW